MNNQLKFLHIDFSNVEIYDKYKDTILSDEILYQIFLQADLPTRARIVLAFGKKFYKYFDLKTRVSENTIIVDNKFVEVVGGIGIGFPLMKISEFHDYYARFDYYELNKEKHGKSIETHNYIYNDTNDTTIRNYKHGKLNGKSTRYRDGKISSVCHHKDDILDGLYIKYNFSGDVETKYEYEKGIIIREWHSY